MPRSDPPSRGLIEAFAAAAATADQLALLRESFRVEPVGADHRFEEEATYFMVGGRTNYLVRTAPQPIVAGRLELHCLVNDAPLKPLDLERLEAAVRRQHVYLLEPKPADTAERDRILDVGAFSLLIDAAQRTGLVPGIATIVQVRDCEFRLGRHWQALQLMESLQQGFLAGVSQRAQRLAREATDIAAGRVKMSPRELQMKRSRDLQQSQCIDRARTRFARVVDGLRVLVKRGL